MTTKDHILRLQNEHRRQLMEAAIDYLRTGLNLFHEYRKKEKATSEHFPPPVIGREHNNPQAALGNLAISVELMLKAIIAGKHLLLLFEKSLPLEYRVLLTSPDDLPPDFNWRAFDMDLRSANYRAIEFDECVSTFYVLFPSLKQSLQPHLRLLSTF
jgi:hypothetical protein